MQSHAREPYERGRFVDAVARAVATARRRIGMQAIVTAVAITAFFGAIIIVLWSGAHDVVAGRMSAGTLGQFVLYAMLGGGSVGALAEVWNDVQRAAGGMGRINELLHGTRAARRARASDAAAAAVARRRSASTTSSSTIPSRADAPALEGFILHVRPGETVALVGPSGAGKSTVFALLLRFHDPQRGSIAIDGIDLRALDPARLRERDRARAAGADDLRDHRRATTSATAGWKPATPTSKPPRARPRRTSSSTPCPRATRANSANAARACPAASSNASPSRARC